MLELFDRHATGENHEIHGELVRPQVAVEEVHREDEDHGHECFFAVDHESDVEDPARQEAGEEGRKPQHESRGSDDRHAPENRPIVELFPVRVAVEVRPGPQANKPAEMLDELHKIEGLWHERPRPPQHAVVLAYEQSVRKSAEMGRKDRHQGDGGDAMENAGHTVATEEIR